MGFEYGVLSVLTVLISLFFLVFGVINLIARFGVLGSFGAKFQYEMDVIMGGLLGLANYSLIEGIILLIGVALALDPYLRASAPQSGLHGALGLLVMVDYLIVCVYYAKYAKQPVAPFAIMSGVLGVLLLWRIRFLPSSTYKTLGIVIALAAVGVAVSVRRMQTREQQQAGVNERFRKIQEFCEARPDFVWETGAATPVGFEG